MKLKELIRELQSISKQLKVDPDVLIDSDDHGFFDLDEVQIENDAGEIVINLKSSNEV